MKIFKLIFGSIIILFLILFLISLFIPRHVRISKTINIRSTVDSIASQIEDLRKWKTWYPGFDTLTIIPADSAGGKLVGGRAGNISIQLEKNQGSTLTAVFKSNKKYPVHSGWDLITSPSRDEVTVIWYFDFKLGWYPWEKFFSLVYDRVYGEQMNQGLQNLKKNVER